MYDFKKNLEKKVQLCEAAERLADVEDPVSAFHQLQKLHQEFRETGPVENEKREEIWNRFKAASTAVNKRHQEHFEGLKAQEEENLTKKTALCEEAEKIMTTARMKLISFVVFFIRSFLLYSIATPDRIIDVAFLL